jgi:hypothetical protein
VSHSHASPWYGLAGCTHVRLNLDVSTASSGVVRTSFRITLGVERFRIFPVAFYGLVISGSQSGPCSGRYLSSWGWKKQCWRLVSHSNEWVDICSQRYLFPSPVLQAMIVAMQTRSISNSRMT